MKTRFAPSPTGPLHLGHAFAAIFAHDLAQAQGGKFLVRIEDIDQSRARPRWETGIFDDLAWLGLAWETPVMRQSARQDSYDMALDFLWAQGLLYPCSCKRRDIFEAASAPQEGKPLLGPDGIVYPGTCRPAAAPTGPRPRATALRLDCRKALRGDLTFAIGDGTTACITPEAFVRTIGDIILARPDMGTSYHLSVVVDDAAQGISHVTRGEDLLEATFIHILLQHLLELPHPVYHHHRLIRDDSGKRLAKRDDDRALALFRADGHNPQDIRRMIGLQPTGSDRTVSVPFNTLV